MTITVPFHNAIILSLVSISDKYGYGIFHLLQAMIRQTNRILSPGDYYLQDESPEYSIKKLQKGEWGGRLGAQSHYQKSDMGHEISIYQEWIINVYKLFRKEQDKDDINWYDLITYLLFIQSNCHHKGNMNSSKLCRNGNSFKNFFYKSNNGFHPSNHSFRHNETWKNKRTRESTSNHGLLGDWWIKMFYYDRDKLLMFNDLSNLGREDPSLGWTVRGFGTDELPGDWIPHGSVINQLRRYYDLPLLSGDYSLGIISVSQKNNYLPCHDKKEKEHDHCMVIGSIIGIVSFTRWWFSN